MPTDTPVLRLPTKCTYNYSKTYSSNKKTSTAAAKVQKEVPVSEPDLSCCTVSRVQGRWKVGIINRRISFKKYIITVS